MRNFLKPGDYVLAEPFGIKLMLRYDSRGVLDFVGCGSDYDHIEEIEHIKLSKIRELSTVPTKIGITGGSTFVYGTLYAPDTPFVHSEGNVSELYISEYISKLNNTYQFVASFVKSNASKFAGAVATRNWLQMSKFYVCPGYLAPANPDRKFIDTILQSNMYEFYPKLIGGFTYFRGTEVYHKVVPMYQFIVSQVRLSVDRSGAILGLVQHAHSNYSMSLNYSEVVSHNIQPGDIVIQQDGRNGQYLFSKSLDCKVREPRLSTIACPVCGKLLNVPKHGIVKCDDNSCLSNHYLDFCSMASVLGIPVISKDKYFKLAKSNEILNIVDILDLPEYKDYNFTLDIHQMLRACIPITEVRSDETLKRFCIRCNNDVDTIRYYIHSPNRIYVDLSMDSIDDKNLISWLSSAYNQTVLEAFISRSNVIEHSTLKKFDGAPIFRGRTICITGRFEHGPDSEIIQILQSYSACVVTELSDDVDCLLIGQLMESIDGSMLNRARANDIPIFYEDKFFNEYGIDDDLKQYT